MTAFDAGPVRRQRWLQVVNVDKYDIPGWGICELDRLDDEDNYYSTDVDNGHVLFRVRRPTDKGYGLGSPSLYMVNSATAIRKNGGKGQCTQDWPAQVLHNGDLDDLPTGWPCGPIPDSFNVWAGVGMFRCLGHDRSRPDIPPNAPHLSNVHTVWVQAEPRSLPEGAQIGGGVGGGTLSPQDFMSFSTGGSQIIESRNVRAASHGVAVRIPGLYLVHFNATFNATLSQASHGATLRISCSIWDYVMGNPSNSKATAGTGWRQQFVDTDIYGNKLGVGAENVAFSCLANSSPDEDGDSVVRVIRFQNTSSTTFFVSSANIVVYRIAGEARRQNTSNPYWLG